MYEEKGNGKILRKPIFTILVAFCFFERGQCQKTLVLKCFFSEEAYKAF